MRDDDREREEFRGASIDHSGEEREPGHEMPREDPFGRGFDRPEPGRALEHRHEDLYTQPYDRWEPREYVFHSGSGYHREFIEPYKMPGSGRYAGRGPKGYSRSDARIDEDVHQRLTDHPELDATEIRVRVDGGEVTLEGSVIDRGSKRLAEDIVESVRGVRDTHNRLRVGPPGRPIAIGREREEETAFSPPPGRMQEFSGETGRSPRGITAGEFAEIPATGADVETDLRPRDDRAAAAGERRASSPAPRDSGSRGNTSAAGPAVGPRAQEGAGNPPAVTTRGDESRSGTGALPEDGGARGRGGRPRAKS